MKSVNFYDYTIYEDGRVFGKYGKFVKPRLKDGHYEIRLSIEGKRKNYILSRLVFHAFNGNEFNIENRDLCIVPINGNKEDSSLGNLKMKHRKDIIQGEKHSKIALLTDEQVKEIQSLYEGKASVNQYDKSGISLRDIASAYGITKANVSSIIKGRSRNPKNYKLK